MSKIHRKSSCTEKQQQWSILLCYIQFDKTYNAYPQLTKFLNYFHTRQWTAESCTMGSLIICIIQQILIMVIWWRIIRCTCNMYEYKISFGKSEGHRNIFKVFSYNVITDVWQNNTGMWEHMLGILPKSIYQFWSCYVLKQTNTLGKYVWLISTAFHCTCIKKFYEVTCQHKKKTPKDDKNKSKSNSSSRSNNDSNLKKVAEPLPEIL